MQKKYRLLKKDDFQFLLSQQQKIFTSYFICYYSLISLNNNINIGIIIPKKKCKLAVHRSYLKRLFWALNTKSELLKLPSIKCLFFFNKKFYDAFNKKEIDFKKMKYEFQIIINKINPSLKT